MADFISSEPSRAMVSTYLHPLPFKILTSIDEGEEVYMSYGPHPNDFLLAECK